MPIASRTGVPRQPPSVERSPFGALPDGAPVDCYTLRAGQYELAALTYGGIIVSLRAPARDGTVDDVVLGHDALEGYLAHSPYFGALIGRCGNRIAQGRFTLDGTRHQLTVNDGPNHLHGGVRGFDKRVWEATPFESAGEAGISLAYASPDGEQGYPGAVRARVTYALGTTGELAIDYEATTDRSTIVNLMQHTYFNLGGAGASDILGHELVINAGAYTPVNAQLIPTGDIESVEGSPFDFRAPARIGARVDAQHEQLAYAGGYDHNFVLDPANGATSLRHAARLREPDRGRTLDVRTTEPGLQLYSGNFLDGSIRGKGGRTYGHRGALCLETQHFPDSPNHPHFPSVTLRPDDTYRSRTIYAFGTDG
jgi:aldose 1-epimerase